MAATNKQYVNLRKKTGKKGDFLVGSNKKTSISYFVFKDDDGKSFIKAKEGDAGDLNTIVESMATLENEYGAYEMGRDEQKRAYFLSRNPKAGEPVFNKSGEPIAYDGKQLTEAEFKLVIAE